MLQQRVRWSLVLISIAVCSLAGCGGESVKLPQTVPFTGKVTLDGTPLAGASVTFNPNRVAKQLHSATGRTNAEGKFELATHVGKHHKPGVMPGNYLVVVSLLKTADGKPFDPMSKAPQIPEQSLKPEYSELQRTKLSAVVGDKGGTQDFDLKSK